MKDSAAQINKKVSRKTRLHGAVKVLSPAELAAFAASRNLSVAK